MRAERETGETHQHTSQPAKWLKAVSTTPMPFPMTSSLPSISYEFLWIRCLSTYGALKTWLQSLCRSSTTMYVWLWKIETEKKYHLFLESSSPIRAVAQLFIGKNGQIRVQFFVVLRLQRYLVPNNHRSLSFFTPEIKWKYDTPLELPLGITYQEDDHLFLDDFCRTARMTHNRDVRTTHHAVSS